MPKRKYLSSDEIKNAQLELLHKFDNICLENGIYYTLGGGSMLGAIRHKGFIPWDDDIDVMMPRDDYNNFINLITKSKKYDCDLILPFDDNERVPFLKLIDKRIKIKSTETSNESYLWMDIFPLDELPSDNLKLEKLFKKCRKNRATVIGMQTDLKTCKKDYKYPVKAAAKLYSKIVGWKHVLKKSDKDAQKYNGTKSEYIGCSLWGYGVGERMKRKEYLVPIRTKFEIYDVNIPSCWDQYLKGLYGDYMELPPVEKRKNHSMKAWYSKCDEYEK
jgi:lipopolysaccharide cholinephosphotransferase